MKKPNQLFNHPLYLTDGGLETTLIYHQGLDLPHFASFPLVWEEKGREALRRYFQPYQQLADNYHLGFLLETPTWRANPDWGRRLDYSEEELMALNRDAVDFIREQLPGSTAQPILVSGNIGPRGDGYKVENRMRSDEAAAYHGAQIEAFTEAGADLVTALTINYSDEAIGIVQEARAHQIPVVISFTVETDGRLPSGEGLREAIEKTDAVTANYAEHYMINCAHPHHFRQPLTDEGRWKSRIKGIRANASTKSHAELDESDTLDTGDKNILAKAYVKLFQLLPELKVIGGCCGTDHTHFEDICRALDEHHLIPGQLA